MSADVAAEVLDLVAVAWAFVCLVGAILFGRRATSVSLALVCSVAGAFIGFVITTAHIENVVIGAAGGATVGLVLGGAIGLLLGRRPTASPTALWWSAAGAFAIGILAIPVMTKLLRVACFGPLSPSEIRNDVSFADFCYWNRGVVGLVALDGVILALLLVLATRQAETDPRSARLWHPNRHARVRTGTAPEAGPQEATGQ